LICKSAQQQFHDERQRLQAPEQTEVTEPSFHPKLQTEKWYRVNAVSSLFFSLHHQHWYYDDE
jgi:hypothetical protein